MEPWVAIVDFGGQYAHLIARRVRALGVMSRIVQAHDFVPQSNDGLVGIILSGGPRSVLEEQAPTLAFSLTTAAVPVLGLCYGHQLMAKSLGGRVARGARCEYGLATVDARVDSRIFAELTEQQTVWMSHGDHVSEVPPGFRVVGSTDDLPVAAMEAVDGHFIGLQFHPEVTHTPNGQLILNNFLSQCIATRPWQPEGIAESLVQRTRTEVGQRRVLLLVSGGVDSLVALAICARALPAERIWAVHVDTGLMRLDESREVMTWLHSLGLSHAELVYDDFTKMLDGIVDPEEKRARIGRRFVDIVNQKLGDLHLDEGWVLVQGTIYPDTIESGATEHAAKIKTHHNRVAEIDALIRAGRVVEPLRDLYKDEVREVGHALALPPELVGRHPFPGPGLGIRVIASHGDEVPPPLEEEFRSILTKSGLDGFVLPIRSVGVQGDERTYRHPAVVWSCAPLQDWRTVLATATEMVNRLVTVNRVVFSLFPLAECSLRLRPTYAELGVLDRLRAVDALFRHETDCLSGIWQMPVVALPLFDENGGQAFVIRPVTSEDAMTAGVYEFSLDFLRTLCQKAQNLTGVGPIFVDVTTKPPATIEWE